MNIIKKACTILIIFFTSLSCLAFEDIAREALLKNFTKRLELLLINSTEARVFLQEDLSASIKLLKSSRILWTDLASEYPFILTTQDNGEIAFPKKLDFKGSNLEKTFLIVKIIFYLKRQMEGSRLIIPEFRIEIFSKKFASFLFSSQESCTISIQELTTVHPSIRSRLFKESSKIASYRNYLYSSSSASWFLIIKGNESTDSGCRGDNRNIYRLSAELLNLKMSINKILFTEEGTSCDYDQVHYKHSLRKFLKKLKKHLPECTESLEF